MDFKQDKYQVKLLEKSTGEPQTTHCLVVRESNVETNVAGVLANLTQQFISQSASDNYDLVSVEYINTEAYEPSQEELNTYIANKTKQ